MTEPVLFARRLLSEMINANASNHATESAGLEYCELLARSDKDDIRALKPESYKQLSVYDFPTEVWLYFLENARRGDAEIPSETIERLYLETSNVAFRFRFVQGVITSPDVEERYSYPLKEHGIYEQVDDLPESWIKVRLKAIEAQAETNPIFAAEELNEFSIYLIQTGTDEAIAVLAAALNKKEDWTIATRTLSETIFRGIDPELTGFGRRLRNVIG